MPMFTVYIRALMYLCGEYRKSNRKLRHKKKTLVCWIACRIDFQAYKRGIDLGAKNPELGA